MHGSLFSGFKQFVVQSHGLATWNAVIHTTGGQGWYLSTHTYPDSELEALVDASATLAGKTPEAVWEDFGAALVPHLVMLYGAYLLPHWRTLDLLENVERVVHRTVRMRDKAAEPPQLRPTRTSPNEVEIEYTSTRRLCGLAVGICRGVAAHYREEVTIAHPECMLTGASRCLLVVRQP
jgi:hypothetical protein